MSIPAKRVFLVFQLAVAVCLTAGTFAHADENPYAPQPQSSLRGMFAISWHKGADLPQGFQDSDGGIVEGTLVTVGGFCQGQTDVPGKEAKYPRGFLQKAWGLNLQSPGIGWQDLPDFPGAARQELSSTVVGGSLYCWGGFSYSSPYCYSDGYRLAKTAGQWAWSALPNLPRPISSTGICAIGSKIYAFGGADYDSNALYTNTDRTGGNARLGARLLVLDTDNLAAGWSELAGCPGTPRFVQATAAAGGKLYVLGGAAGNDNSTGNYATVVDNWQYDPAADAWTRLRDLPVASGNFPAGSIVYDNRYILLVGGAQYGNVIGPDGSITTPYGTVSKYYPENPYNSDIFVYDTLTSLFGTATGLPLNNNLPMTVVEGNRIHLIGGEIRSAVIEGKPFGHHPDLYLVGTIQVVPEPGTVALLGVAVLLFGVQRLIAAFSLWSAAINRCTPRDGRRFTMRLLGLLLALCPTSPPLASASDTPYAPQPQASLKPMLSIDWKKGPNLPQGFQDSVVGILDHTLVTAGGFCQGSATWSNAKELDAKKPGRYPRGFLNKAWALDLDNLSSGWTPLPSFPAIGRQGGVGIAVNDTLYGWGGFNYSEPFCYSDGYRLSKRQDGWKWDALPLMPSPTGGSAICTMGSKIYVCGGADYDEKQFYTATDRSGSIKRLGSRLLVIDTNDLAAGWKRLPECPGTPRWVAGMAAVRERVYLIGGATGDVSEVAKSEGIGYCTVVDNWTFDPTSNQWSRLRDLPISSGNFYSGRIAYRDRYILLVGGAQYAKVANPDGTIRDKYGVASRFQNKGNYWNDVFVYDTQSNLFGTADKLPLNNNGTMTIVYGDRVFLLGGETGGAVVEGEPFGHHPDLCLVGTIREK